MSVSALSDGLGSKHSDGVLVPACCRGSGKRKWEAGGYTTALGLRGLHPRTPAAPQGREFPGRGGEPYEKTNDAALKKAAGAFKLIYYAYGREDFVARNTDQLKGTLSKYGIKFMVHETGGGHTWINWRAYLNDFAQRLFK